MRLFKHTYGPKAQQRKAAKWYVELTFRGKRVRLPAYADKNASAEFGRKVQRLADLVDAGSDFPPDIRKWLESLVDIHRDRLARHGLLKACELGTLRRLAEHLADFVSSLRQAGRTEKHASMIGANVTKILADGGFEWWADLTPDSIRATLASLREKRGWSAQTHNHYLAAIHQFCLWVVAAGRAFECPTKGIKGPNVDEDRRHERRALSEAEIQRLLAVTRHGPERWGVSGEWRSLLYLVALETGLRANELKTVTVGRFDLVSDSPKVVLKAKNSKRRRADQVPLREDTADLLRDKFSALASDALAFQMPPVGHLSKMIRADLEAAGIPYVDSEGCYADFHALRHTFVTRLDRTRCSVKVAQTLARHSTPNLTFKVYAHSRQEHERQAVASLPPLVVGELTANAGDLGAGLVQQPVQHRTSPDPKVIESTGERGVDAYEETSHPVDDLEVALVSAAQDESRRGGRVVDRVGFENRPPSSQNPQNSTIQTTHARHLVPGLGPLRNVDLRLAEIVRAWDGLSEPTKAALTALVRAVRHQSGSLTGA